MNINEIKEALEQRGIRKSANATIINTYSDTPKLSSLLIKNGSNRAQSNWKTAQYIIVKNDDTQTNLDDLLRGWSEVVGEHSDQYLIVEIEPDTWLCFDSNCQEVDITKLLYKDTRITGYEKYRQYITAIKSKPFLLLAGISGTGKSRIVRELARSCWAPDSEEYQAQKPRNFEMIQVKPNWHDSSELLGYVSRINGKTEYIVGDFLRFINEAWKNWLSDNKKPYFLCLDEMNLAPVEQYFAEYLSVLESRRKQPNGIESDALIKKGTTGFENLIDKELAWEKQEVHDLYNDNGICLPPNLIVVGTVNMDETTFSFSRKVLDRAMTIEMNEVDLWGGLTNKYEPIGQQSIDTLIGTAVEGSDVYNDYETICETCLEYLKKVNAELEGTPFKIAYRTRNEVLLYVVNNLPYNQSENGDTLSNDYVIARALDEITNMKILSRIEGDETRVKKDLLKDLIETIKEGLTSITGLQYGAKAKNTDEEQVEKSISIAKLEEMAKKLSESGYTSYWS